MGVGALSCAVWRRRVVDEVKVKVKFTLEQATKAQKKSKDVAVLFA
jgi:hypothetical protein